MFEKGDIINVIKKDSKHNGKEGIIIDEHGVGVAQSPSISVRLFGQRRWKVKLFDNTTPIFIFSDEDIELNIVYKRNKKLKDLGI